MVIPTPFNHLEFITKSDTVDLPLFTATGRLTDAILVGGAGIIVAVLQDNTTVTITGVVAGAILPIAIRRINSTTTSATNVTAMYAI